MFKRLFSSSLRVKLLAIPTIALIVVFLIIGILLRDRFVKTVRAGEDRQMEHLSGILLESYANARNALSTCARLTILHETLHDGYFGTQAKDYAFLRGMLGNASCEPKIDDVLAVNNMGRVMFRMAGGSANTAVFQGLLDKILNHGPITDRTKQLADVVVKELIKDGEMFKLASAVPILNGTKITGALVFIKNFDAGFLLKQKDKLQSRGEVSIATADSVVASTLDGLSLSGRLREGRNYFDGELNGRFFKHFFMPMEESKAFLGMSYDVSEDIAATASVRNIIFIIFAAAIVIFLVILRLNTEHSVKSLDNLVNYAGRISEGDFSTQVQKTSDDEVGKLTDAMNKMGEKVKAIIDDIQMLNKSAKDGKLDVRADCTFHKGEYCEIIKGTNNTLDAVITPLNMAVEYVHQISRGVIPPKVTQEYKGEFMMLEANLNNLIDAMEEVAGLAGEIADGNLMVEIKQRSSRDKLRQSLALMVKRLTDVVLEFQRASTKVAFGSQELSSNSDQMSKGATEQAHQAEQVVVAMNQMSSTVIDVAKNAMEATVASNDTAESANRGLEIVGKTVVGMHKVDETVNISARTIGELGRSSQEISKIINTINDIADQTNLLALNAAIEAARAGELGRGFAVVADEVRKLAERTGKATYEIAEIIKNIQNSTDKAVEGIKSVKEEVADGVKLSEEARSALNQIVENSKRGTDMVQRIAVATEEQSSSTAEVTASMEAISQVTKDIEDSSDNIKNSAHELAAMSEGLKAAASWFRLKEGEADTDKGTGSTEE
jgi:methyl-accepting chemotaxis protein